MLTFFIFYEYFAAAKSVFLLTGQQRNALFTKEIAKGLRLGLFHNALLDSLHLHIVQMASISYW